MRLTGRAFALAGLLLGVGCQGGASEPTSYIRATIAVDGASEARMDRPAMLMSSDGFWSCASVPSAGGYAVLLGWRAEDVTGPTALEASLVDGATIFLGYPTPGGDPFDLTYSSASNGTVYFDSVDVDAALFEGTFDGVRVEREGIVVTAGDGEFRCEP